MSKKVLLVASEVSPYAKTGGLGDVLGILPKEMREQGLDVKVIFPKYEYAVVGDTELVTKFSIGLGFTSKEARVHEIVDDRGFYMVENAHYFMRNNIYGYGDDHERFYFFTRAALEFIKRLDWKPDVIHFNDWQTGMGSFYLKEMLHDDAFYEDISTVFSIHNIQHQGNFDRKALVDLDISDYYFTPDKIEMYDRLNFMKAGLVYSDAIVTVSQKYAKEIQTPSYGFGLDGVIGSRKNNLYGIINGIDYDDIDFMQIPKDKRYLQERVGLEQRDVPVFALITRLAEQKGIDIIAGVLDELLSKDIQLIVLGTGEERYERLFKSYAEKYNNLSVNLFFDTQLSMDIYKHSDMFLMPSLFEPCGLAQMISMKYGTVPVVRKTGGLEDTVTHFDRETGSGNGFSFEDYDATGLMWAINQALEVYYDKYHWERVVINATNTRLTVRSSAKKYLDLYNNMRG